jgi:hypothetical protein
MSAEQITATATCVVAIATVVGFAIAALGLKIWRVQLEGSAHFELARRLLLEVYRLRDAIERVRHPMMLVSEAAGADPNVPWEISAYERRWQDVLSVRAPLEVCVYECHILFGDEITALERELMKQVQTLYLAVRAFAQSKHRGDDRDLGQEHRDVLYGGMGDDDFSVQLQAIVARLEVYAGSHLPGKGSRRER